MRIVVVSAHFPPNFVSGGTLQPQRLARGLRDRGHDVSVYAGWLDDEHEPGSSWDDTDETGLPIRWIATSPWTDWASRMNYDNPTVTADFSRHLETVQPDVVHFHALQSLGAGLVRVASGSGAATVVTMHDFWWCCGRQFLVDRDGRPCPEVVATGVCACAVDRRWLDERNAWLHDELQYVDLALTPSGPAAAVLQANGIDRVEVDENGVPDAVASSGPSSRRPRRDGPVHFVYAGGPDELKGVRVVFDAFEELASLPGWHLRVYGRDPWVDHRVSTMTGLPIEVHDAFPSRETAAVLDRADVLLVPSLARESYSLLTREALARGLAVICSDCLGPEEVVTHGHNGLVVPTGDARALAAAVRDVVDDRDALDALLAGAGNVALRSLDDQVQGLEHRYETLIARRPVRPARESTPIRRVLFVVGIDGAPLRYRAWLPAEALELSGVESEVVWYTDPDLHAAIDRADAVVVYRVPATVDVLTAIERARERGTPVLFDADDLIFDPDVARGLPALASMSEQGAEHYLTGVSRYRTTMERCDVYIASTPMLARRASELTALPVERFDNGVGMVLGRLSDREARRSRRPGPLRIGYFSGSDSHDHDWTSVEGAIERVLVENGDVELWLGGHLRATPALDRFGARVRRLPFVEWTALPSLLRDLDVNLSPLARGDDFNEAKSAIKWLEAALVGTATVATPTEPFRDAIEHGRNGVLASHDDEWVTGILELLADDARRTRIGRQARRDALLRWSPHLQAQRYVEILDRSRSAAKRVAAARSTWSPVVEPEAPRRHQLQPYANAAPNQRAAWRTRVAAVRSLVRRLGRSR